MKLGELKNKLESHIGTFESTRIRGLEVTLKKNADNFNNVVRLQMPTLHC